MSSTTTHAAVVTAAGHLVDSEILKVIFDRVIERGGAFEVLHFDLGRTNEDFLRLTLRVSTATAEGPIAAGRGPHPVRLPRRRRT